MTKPKPRTTDADAEFGASLRALIETRRSLTVDAERVGRELDALQAERTQVTERLSEISRAIHEATQ